MVMWDAFFSSFLGEWPGKLGLASGERALSAFTRPGQKARWGFEASYLVLFFICKTSTLELWPPSLHLAR